MLYEMTGTVKLVKETQTFNSGFTKREFVLTTEDDRFPQEVAFACIKDGCALLDGVQAGERLRVSFNIRGREYQGRHFVNLECFKFERLDATAAGEGEAVPADEPPLDDSMPF
ncbi:MAG: DUF3127 domain-containing protein [Lentisphaerae bacterium]|jgi:hypothetical protein|nr:DUF3127 domain-containing protein [Lentisphaerota bacterium]